MVIIGETYKSNNCGEFKVIAKVENKHDTFIIRFNNTGTEKETRGFQILDGCIRDQFAPLLCGVACTGNLSTKREFKPFYSIWHDMINRCYNKKNKRYNPNFEVTVCDRWLVFENFYNDISLIEGYDFENIKNGNLVLDKDIKQRNQPKKIYSVKTCKWVEATVNNEIQDRQQHTFIAVSPKGEVYKDYNVARFARQHDISKNSIRELLYKRKDSVKGWKISFEEIV